MTPEQLSHELREGTSDRLKERRWIIGLSFVGAAMGGIVGLYQTGILKHLPDPPIGPFDSDRVDASNYAYKRMQTPDAFMMLVSYGITAWLAAAGGERRHPALAAAMALKILADIGVAVQLAGEEWQQNEALCAYCQVATIASLASAAFAYPELSRALAAGLGTDHKYAELA